MNLVDTILLRAAQQTPGAALWARVNPEDWVTHLKDSRRDFRVELMTNWGVIQAGVVAVLNDMLHVQVSRNIPTGHVDFSVCSFEEAIAARPTEAEWTRVAL